MKILETNINTQTIQMKVAGENLKNQELEGCC